MSDPSAWPHASERLYRGGYEPHAHVHAQVLVGLSGRLDMEVEGRAAFVDAACGLLVPAGARHAYESRGAARVLVVDCDATEGLDRLRRFLVPPALRTAGGALRAATVLEAVRGARRVKERAALRLDLVDAALARELHAPWSTRTLAALCHLSPQRLRARFIELTGSTPMDYVRRRRLDVATLRLKAGWTLEATALHVGYASASALAYALRRDRALGARALRRTA